MNEENENAPSLQLNMDENIDSDRMNLDESGYDWAKFENKCDLIRNYLLSQPSMCKS